MILFNEGATQSQEDEAEQILQVLTFAYPGYPWAVRVYDGGFFIRNLMFDGNYGMNCKFKSVGHDWAVMKREIIGMAGEWLERANLRRGRANEDPIVKIEGVPEHRQPNQPLDADKFAVVAADSNVQGAQSETEVLRSTPRPQALKAAYGD